MPWINKESLGVIFLGAACFLFSGTGCQPTARPNPKVQATDGPGEAEPPDDPNVANVVELSEGKATRDGDLVHFEVHYRFKSGRSNQHYQCVFSVPGTKNHGIRTMDAWELKKEGVIKDSIQLYFFENVEKFELKFLESRSPMLPYKQISNTLTGPIKGT